MSAKRVIGVDLGGTKILAGAVDGEGRMLEQREVPTPKSSQDELLDAIAAAIEPLASEGLEALGFGIPSILDRRAGRVLASNNIPLADVALGQVMSDRFEVPVAVENDGNVAALAESKLGAGRGADNVVVLTLGTGVGGGVVLDGSLFRGWAELGHVVVVADGAPCQGICTGRGHLEVLASGNAADIVAARLWGEGADAELLVERARAGAGDALEGLAGIGRLLGAAIGSFANIFGAELVVVGGGFGEAAGDLLFPAAVEVARRETFEPLSSQLRVVPAQLGSDAGLIGAGLLALEALDSET